MAQTAASPLDSLSPLTGLRQRLKRRLPAVMEGGVLLLVILSPWAFGSVDAPFEALLDLGVAVLVLLWGLRMLLEGQITWKKSAVALCLAGLVVLGAWQLVSLPKPWLGVLSPATVRLDDTFLPQHTEVLPGGAAREAPAWPPGSTLSIYPTATRSEAIRILAVLLLFLVVLNNVASPASLRRLCLVALVNGSLLALFGLFQFFTSPPETVYWTYPTPGNVFGPFINRNHFAFYMNLCVGLGLGLLVRPGQSSSEESETQHRAASSSRSEAGEPRKEGTEEAGTRPSRSRRRRSRRKSGRHRSQEYRVEGEKSASWSPLGLLKTPRKLWILLPLALMASSILFSLSRGGFVAFVVAALGCLALTLRRGQHFSRLATLVGVPVVLAFVLLLWFGFDRVATRLATLTEGETFQASRLPLWATTLPLIQDFPIWGTGLGTFTYAETLHRTDPTQAQLVYEHAHNEYLEVLIEGGIVGLLLFLLAIVLVFRQTWRTLHAPGRSVRALALASLFALLVTVIHSFVEFGLHIPAIVVLLTVVCAEVYGLGSSSQGTVAGTAGSVTSWRWGGLAPVVGALASVLFALVLAAQGVRGYTVQALQDAAQEAREDETQPEPQEQYIARLEEAAQIAPEYARLQAKLGQAHLDAIEEQRQLMEAGPNLSNAIQLTLLPAALTEGTFPELVVRASTPFGVLGTSLQEALRQQQGEAEAKHLVPGLRHCLLARDLCPTLPGPQIRLAEYADRMQQADPRNAYLERAKLLVPFDAEVLYACGQQELLDHQNDQAWANWRRSLELSDRRLADIVARSSELLSPEELLDQVLPDRPDELHAAALQLYPDPDEMGLEGLDDLKRTPYTWAGRLVLASAGAWAGPAGPLEVAFAETRGWLPVSQRRPFLERALTLLNQQAEPLSSKDLHLKAQILWSLWQLDAATATYQAALAQEGLNADWRYELAQLLYQQGRLREARRELLFLLSLPSPPAGTQDLLRVVTFERATKQEGAD